jgi:hypothetical protein
MDDELGWEDVELIWNEEDQTCSLTFKVIGTDPSKEELIVVMLDALKTMINDEGMEIDELLKILDGFKNNRVLN